MTWTTKSHSDEENGGRITQIPAAAVQEYWGMSLRAFNPKAQEGADLLAAATAIRRRLCEAGFSPIPVDGKRPVLTGWQNKALTNPVAYRGWSSHNLCTDRVAGKRAVRGGLCLGCPIPDVGVRQ
jgi:hypothetical protein